MPKTNYQTVDKVLKTAAILLAVTVLVLGGLIVKSVFFPDKSPRSELERQVIELKAQIKKNPKDGTAYNDLGVIYQEAGQYDEAVKQFKLALKYNRKLDKPHYNMAMIYKEQGKIAKEIAELNKVLKLNSAFSLAYFELGKIAFNKKDYKQAADNFLKAANYSKTTTDYHFWLGKTYEKLNKPDKAIAEYQEVLKYIPGEPEATKALNRLKGGAK